MRFPERSSGVLLHLSSLPSRFGVGDLGPAAAGFLRTISAAGQRYWQMLPVTPTDAGTGSSPYSSPSAFAGNTLFISPELLVEQGFLPKKELASAPAFSDHAVDFAAVAAWKDTIFRAAFGIFQKHRKHLASEFDLFFAEHRGWLEDYALFAALKSHFGGKSWHEWAADLRDRTPKNLDIARGSLSERIEAEYFRQFLFFRQWRAFKRQCHEEGVRLVGDIPMYVSYDSTDVWRQPHLFQLDGRKHPVNVAGVPPDYFSKTGQRWGNPLFDWEAMEADGFRWWIARLGHALAMFDLVRIDHFRGLVAYWSIPAGDRTAENGSWRDAPADAFLRAVARSFPSLPLIAEDLGTISADVREILAKYDLPGMKVLQFAFGDDVAGNAYAPHNIGEHAVLYTGTHDNNTTRGWFAEETSPALRQRLELYTGSALTDADIHRHFLRMALGSAAKLVILPVQDVLGLASGARMNTPGVANGNWTWRMDAETDAEAWDYLKQLTEMFGRA